MEHTRVATHLLPLLGVSHQRIPHSIGRSARLTNDATVERLVVVVASSPQRLRLRVH